VDAVDGLRLLGVGPAELGEHHVGGHLQVEPDAGGGERADGDRDLRVVGEGVDALLPAAGGLVAAHRDVADAPLLEGPLGGVHDVDVLGEQHDLAGAARELGGVVRAGTALAWPMRRIMLNTFSESWVSLASWRSQPATRRTRAASTPVWTTPGSRTSSALR
jgi:hypothetical protein